ncbi:MAG TPA: hypothetical protein PK665_15170 [Ignavibacteriaceae bacterium]|nr:hypothetical protein [Ignavibacteriaceae bacterium]
MANLNVKKCGNCWTRIVIMNTKTGSILPVEVEEGKTYTDDDVFDYKIHKSHLLKCVEMRNRWKRFQYDFFKRQESLLALSDKDLLR